MDGEGKSLQALPKSNGKETELLEFYGFVGKFSPGPEIFWGFMCVHMRFSLARRWGGSRELSASIVSIDLLLLMCSTC